MKQKVPHAVVIGYNPTAGITGRAWGGERLHRGQILVFTRPEKIPFTFIGWYRLKKAWLQHKWWQFSCTVKRCLPKGKKDGSKTT